MHQYLFPSLFIHLLLLALLAMLPTGGSVKKTNTSPMAVKIISADETGQKRQTKVTSVPKEKPALPDPVAKSTPRSKSIPRSIPKMSAPPILPPLPDRPDALLEPNIAAPAGPVPLFPNPVTSSKIKQEGVVGLEGKETIDQGQIRQPSGSRLPGEAVALYDPSVVQWAAISKKTRPPAITLDTAEFKQLGYMYKLKSRIEQAWQYPVSAMRLGMTGDLYIQFVIQEDGSLKEVRLLRTSGNPILDEAALQAIKDAAPFLPLPKQWKTEQFAIKGRFVYTLNGQHIR